MLTLSAAAMMSFPLAFLAEPEAALRKVSTFPEIVIRKTETEHEWAFSIAEGELMCVTLGGTRMIFFAEILADDEIGEIGNMKLPRMVVVSVNPLAFLATMEDLELYLPFDSLETLIRRLAPFYDMGRAICVQPDDGQQDL